MTLAHIIFLFHFRSILIVTLPLPVSILISFILMKQFGITSNIMSLTGIAIAIGVLVDAAIVVTENVIRHAEEAERRMGGTLTAAKRCDVMLAAVEAGRPPDLLRDGDHHPRVRAGVRADRAGGEAVSSARLYQDVRDGRLDAARGHHRAGALHLLVRGRSTPRSATLSCAACSGSTIRRSIGRCAGEDVVLSIAGVLAAGWRLLSRSACRDRSIGCLDLLHRCNA